MRGTYSIIFFLLLVACSPVREENFEKIKVSQKKKSVVIAIDAGHGGKDPGAHSLSLPRAHEKTLALETALLLKTYLSKLGYTVVMTRADDAFIPLKERARFPSQTNAQLFVSIHYNSARNTQATGIEVYYYQSKERNERRESSKQLGEFVCHEIVKKTRMADRGVKHGNFCVVRENTVPAILVEGGFMSNEADMKRMRSPAYLNQVAIGIARGVDAYVSRSH